MSTILKPARYLICSWYHKYVATCGNVMKKLSSNSSELYAKLTDVCIMAKNTKKKPTIIPIPMNVLLNFDLLVNFFAVCSCKYDVWICIRRKERMLENANKFRVAIAARNVLAECKCSQMQFYCKCGFSS